MPKLVVVVLADTKTHGDLGRAVNALQVAKEFKEAGDEVALVFDGAGTRWIPEFANPEHRRHELWCAVKDKVAGACNYCSQAFGVKDEVHATGVKLLSDYDDNPSLRGYVVEGYQVLTF